MIFRFINLSLRASTLLGKFLLIFFLARFMDPQDVGLYGLVTVSVSYGLYIIGLDFYAYSSRELVKKNRDEWGAIFKNKISFFSITYILFLPLLLFFFVFDLLPWTIAGWLFLLLIVEHIGQELHRILVVISKQMVASATLFIRTGLWCLILIVWILFEFDGLSLNTVFLFWFVGGLSGIAISIWSLYRIQFSGWGCSIDWKWIHKGLKISIPLLLGTLALRGIYTVDRYWFEILVSREVLGAYVLFMSMCNALLSFLDAGVFMYSYPTLIDKFNKKDEKGFFIEVKKLWLNTFFVCLVFTISSYIVLDYVVEWLENEVYYEYKSLFWWLLVSSMLFSISMVPHYILYSRNNDKPIIYSHFFGFLIFLISVFLFKEYSYYYAIPMGLIVSYSFIFYIKYFAYKKALSLKK